MDRSGLGGRCWLLAGIVALAALLLGPVHAASAAVITVTTSDGGPVNDNGICSLREALLNARNNDQGAGTDDCPAGEAAPALDEIRFNIGGGGPQTISPNAAFTALSGGPLSIDGTTQPGADALPRITLDGVGAGGGVSGFQVTGADVTIRSLAIVRFVASGIEITAGAQRTTIEGNHIGVERTGLVSQFNGTGITLTSAFTTTIGGTTAGQRNVISGNGGDGIRIAGSNGVTIQGNFIGTNSAGTASVPNGSDGIEAGPTAFSLLVGGTASGAGNLISGNARHGVIASGNAVQLTVQGNRIGTNLAGTAALQNIGDGVRIDGQSNNARIGGTDPGAGNLISGNAGHGVDAFGVNSLSVQGNVIGLNGTGTAALANLQNGIRFADASGTVGGATAAARNVISGNVASGISIDDASSNVGINGNYIGTNVTGTAAVPNQLHGIEVLGTNHGIGGSNPAEGNLISGNLGSGIIFESAQLVDVRNNLIGTDVTGTLPIPNGNVGISIGTSNRIEIGDVETAGRGNTIAFNGAGVVVADNSDRIGIVDNRIFGNTVLGIDLAPVGVNLNDLGDGDGGANPGQNYPVISAAASNGTLAVAGTLNGTPNTNGIRIQIFGSAVCDFSLFGEGERFLGEVTVNTDASGNASWSALTLPPVPSGTFITTTASAPTGLSLNTSEFSACRAVSAAGTGPIVVNPTAILTNEAGGQGNVSVVLSAQPADTVTIPLSSSDLTEGTLAVTQLVFTPQNWNVPQLLVVTGANDAEVDGPVAYAIVTGPAVSSDPAYNGVNPADVAATNLDDDVIPTNPTPPSGGAPNGGVPSGAEIAGVSPNNDGQGESGKPKNEREDDARETETERYQRERTNRSGEDDERTEGNVVEVDLTAIPRTATIATRDGLQVVVLLCRDSCAEPQVGDYLEADGWKEHEGLFYADSVTSRPPRR